MKPVFCIVAHQWFEIIPYVTRHNILRVASGGEIIADNCHDCGTNSDSLYIYRKIKYDC